MVMPLMVWQVGPGDAVMVPAFTFAATAEVVAWLGATPVFVDIDRETFNMSPASLEAAIEDTLARGALRPRAVIAVDLFGLPANYPAIRDISRRYDLKLLADAAQGFGATRDGHQAGYWADVVCTSFFPAKPLGCYGDGGAILTNDDHLAEGLRSIRMHGQGTDKYDNVRIGLNARLDTIQAAILLEKLPVFSDEIAARNHLADRYEEMLAGCARTPVRPDGVIPTWAQYTLLIEGHERTRVAQLLKADGIPTAVYYPRPLHRQTAYRTFPVAPGGAPVAEEVTAKVLSLPIHPYLEENEQDRVVAALRRATKVML
jgi:dTDP-4-amino-4,6-dideoxygalactose transaminase